MDIQYIGEWIWASHVGNFLVVLSFVAAIVAFVAYAIGGSKTDDSWKLLGRKAFRLHTFSVIGVIAIMFIILMNHRYEFAYVSKHLNNAMPMRYILSCFWEGQEGSFLLWIFWNIVLGNVVIMSAGRWEARVMSIFGFVQLVLSSMILGVYFGDYQFGLNPFLLVRELPENIGMPWTYSATYMQDFPKFQDGRGLNPLLQNYWMTIHPPTVFLGFASTLVPFAYAIAGLWKKEYTEWMKPATPWAFFGVMILGLGILMGGAWAYEALSFGGFWAWDPVENSSLVPWVILTAGAHLLLVNRRKNTSLFTTFFLIMMAFVLTVYSTFLTKSGILGDTSVHSFVDSGILPQLSVFQLLAIGMMVAMFVADVRLRLAYIAMSIAMLVIGASVDGVNMTMAFIVVSAGWLIYAYRAYLPKQKTEEELWSREFWMFIGSLILMVAAIQITWQTSIPVFNTFLEPLAPLLTDLYRATGWDFLPKLAKANLAPVKDIELAYHRFQVPLAFLFVTLIAVTQFFKWKKSNIKDVLKSLLRSFLISVVISSVLLWAYPFGWEDFPLIALLFAAVFAICSNFDYIIKMRKGKFLDRGASVAHIGFALVMLGALISTGQQDFISKNQIGDIRSLNEELDNSEDILLLQNDTLPMGDYFISYVDRYQKGIHLNFVVDYFQREPIQYKTGDIVSHRGMLFEAIQDHEAASQFGIEDVDKNWRFIPIPNPRQTAAAKKWKSGTPGEKLFSLEPNIQLNEIMGNSPEPDTKHYLGKDLYTHIKWGRITPPETDEQGYLEGKAHNVTPGDSILVSNVMVAIDSLSTLPISERERYGVFDDDVVIRAGVTLSQGDSTKLVEPLYIIRGTMVVPDLVEVDDWGLKMRINSFNPQTSELNITLWEHESIRRDFIVMQAIIFPQINILWAGIIIMTLGSGMAVFHRIRNRKRKA